MQNLERVYYFGKEYERFCNAEVELVGPGGTDPQPPRNLADQLTLIYSEKATKFCEISTLLLSYVVPVKSKWRFRKILWPSQNI